MLISRENSHNGVSGNVWITYFYAREEKIRGEEGEEGVSGDGRYHREREFFFDNLLIRIH